MQSTRRMIVWLVAAVAIVGDLGYTQTDKSGEGMLQGVVRSKDEGLLEGVLVGAKRVSPGVMVKEPEYTVVSDNQGRYRFPAGKLQPGKYDLRTWAVGYDSVEKSGVEVLPNKPAPVDFMIEKLQDKSKFALQLSHTEVELTLGSPQIRPCGACHSTGRILTKNYEPFQWEQLILRMKNYGPPSSIRRGGIVVVPHQWLFPEAQTQADKELAQYLSSVVGRDKLAGLQFKTLPRPTGAATKVILTSYDLARENSAPHDVVFDEADGIVWHSDTASPSVGKLDPRTGETWLYQLPEDTWGFPWVGTYSAEIDNEGNPWFGVQSGGSIVKLDKGTGKVTIFPLQEGHVDRPIRPGQVSFRTNSLAVGSPDGKIWIPDTGNAHPRKHIHRFDPRTGVIEHFPLPDKENHGLYGITVDSKGNAYFAGLPGNTFGKVDAKTGKITYYPPPTPNSGPRRIRADGKDRVWFAQFYASSVARFDPATEQIREWPLPSPYAGAYAVAPDKNGDMVWVSGNYDDRIYRLDTRTGEVVGYALPRPFPNVQRLSVDNLAKVPTVWVGEDNYGKATKIEVLEDTK